MVFASAEILVITDRRGAANAKHTTLHHKQLPSSKAPECQNDTDTINSHVAPLESVVIGSGLKPLKAYGNGGGDDPSKRWSGTTEENARQEEGSAMPEVMLRAVDAEPALHNPRG